MNENSAEGGGGGYYSRPYIESSSGENHKPKAYPTYIFIDIICFEWHFYHLFRGFTSLDFSQLRKMVQG